MQFRLAASAVTAVLAIAGCAAVTPQNNGMITMKSPYTAAKTMQRLEGEVRKRGLAVAARINHAAGAAQAGMTLRPTELLIFGNPKAGTPLMQCAQTAGIDLPMKALIWVDARSQVWLGYNDPVWLVSRHGGGECRAAENVRKALAAIATATVAQQ